MKDHSGLKNITIVIPVRPDDIPEKSIASVGKMDYPAELMEVLIAEGWFPSLQRNEAVKKAKGDIVYFLDDDSDAPPDTLIKAVKHLNDSGADVVGGPSLTPDTDTFIQKCFALMFASPFGGFNIRHRHKKSGKYRSATEREAVHEEVYQNRSRSGQAVFSGSRASRRGWAGRHAQAAARWFSCVFRRGGALPDRHGSLRLGALLGARASRHGP